MNEMRKLMEIIEGIEKDEGRRKEFRQDGFHDAKDGVYYPESYAKGWARDAYREGKKQWVELMGQER